MEMSHPATVIKTSAAQASTLAVLVEAQLPVTFPFPLKWLEMTTGCSFFLIYFFLCETKKITTNGPSEHSDFPLEIMTVLVSFQKWHLGNPAAVQGQGLCQNTRISTTFKYFQGQENLVNSSITAVRENSLRSFIFDHRFVLHSQERAVGWTLSTSFTTRWMLRIAPSAGSLLSGPGSN